MGTPFTAATAAPATLVRPATDAQIIRALVPMLNDRDWASSKNVTYVERAAVLKLVISWAVAPMAETTPPEVSRAIHNAVGRNAAYGERVNAILAHLASVTDSAQRSTLSVEKLYAPLTKEGASKLISWLDDQASTVLQAQEQAVGGAPSNDWVDAETVPAGSYALEITDSAVGNDIAFYQVDRPTEGRWAGFVFVKLLVGGDEQRLSIPNQKAVLRKIAAVGAREASILFGIKTEKCGVCHTRLTNKDSREAGIGPDCRKKFGW